MKRGNILGRYAIIPQSNESLAAADAARSSRSVYGEAWQIPPLLANCLYVKNIIQKFAHTTKSFGICGILLWSFYLE
jgi:hypothetical protein